MENQNVSFVIAVHWGGDTIEKCIRSILDQKFNGKVEVVIVDDACKDDAIVRISNLAEENKEIKIIKNERNLGLGASLNKAVENSTYENIVITICDYIFEDKKWTQKMLDAINSDNNVVSCESYLVVPQYMLKNYNYLNKLSLLCYFRKADNIGGAPNVMFKKRAFLEVGGYDTNTYRIAGEDEDIRRRLLKKGYKIIKANELNTQIMHIHGAHNPGLKELLIHKALPVGGEAPGVLFRKHGVLESKIWNPITATVIYGGLLIPYFRIAAGSLLVVLLSTYTYFVATKIRDVKATLAAPFFKAAKDIFCIIGFWKGFFTGKQTFK